MNLKYIESKCSGCRTCQLICALKNFQQNNPSKAALRIEGQFPAPGKYVVHLCNQCGACAEVCPVDAISLENGAYLIHDEICIGCMNCVEACPKGVMMKHKDLEAPFKCINCGECVEICPRDAIAFEK